MWNAFSTSLVLALVLTGACGASTPRPAAPTTTTGDGTAAAAHGDGLRIALTTVYVDDQDRALRFYTEVLGFAKKDDVSRGGFRWLTVTAPADPHGTELQLALDDNPAGKAYQEAIFQQGQPAVMFYTDDVARDYERIKAAGAEFKMAPTSVTGANIATLDDTCGNLIQLTQLRR